MVASGLPIRNGQQHAKEIALMSLHIVSEVKDFTIRHKPGYKLKLRVGVHTGKLCSVSNHAESIVSMRKLT